MMKKMFAYGAYLWLCGFLAMLPTMAVFAEPQSAKALVSQLYKAYAWEAKAESNTNSPTLIDESREVLTQYFDNKLTDLILKDRACAKKTKEVCRLDFSPIWASQDPSVSKKLNISGTNDPEIVLVEIRYEGQKPLKLTYHVAETKAGLRITDIEYDKDSSLLNILGH